MSLLPSDPSIDLGTHRNPHFIPAAFLAKWHTPHEKPHLDDRLVAFTVKGGRLVWSRYKSKSVASQVGLYATPWRGSKPRTWNAGS